MDELENMPEEELNELKQKAQQHGKWLQKAQEMYSNSTDYMERSVRTQWQRNLHNFNSQHPPESKFNSDAYKARSKVFRPKTREAIRQHDAAIASALFTNNDLIDVKGIDPNDENQDASAKLNKQLLQYRLEHTIPWFLTVVGAYQTANTYGICISKQYWNYERKPIFEEVYMVSEDGDAEIDDDGNPIAYEIHTGYETIKDEPVIDLIAPENFRFDQNADWRCPEKDSPYLIEMIPMYAGEILQKMVGDEDPWFSYSLSEILSGGSEDDTENSTIRQSREGNRRFDPIETNHYNEYTTVWVHFNIFKENGEDYAFFTLGTNRLLSEPKPLKEYYFNGRDAYKIGFTNIEAHKNYPASTIQLGEQLQGELNDVVNQRMDNVKLVLNKRYFIRRDANIDFRNLTRNVPGGGVVTNDPDKDIRIVTTPDVTASSYHEQDRLAIEADSILGTMSQASVQSNRALNETVGGMNLISNSANTIQELMIRTFIESWVEPVLRSMVKLEQMYETDEVILMVAASRAQIVEEFRSLTQEQQDKLIQMDLAVNVNVGMGNTNPDQKIKRLMTAVNATINAPGVIEQTNIKEVVKEIYAYAGYGDGERFIKSDEEIEKEREQAAHSQQQEQPYQLQLEQMRQQFQAQLEQAKMQFEANKFQAELQARQELEMIKLATQKEIKLSELQSKLGIESNKVQTQRDSIALQERNKANEMILKTRMGSGI